MELRIFVIWGHHIQGTPALKHPLKPLSCPPAPHETHPDPAMGVQIIYKPSSALSSISISIWARTSLSLCPLHPSTPTTSTESQEAKSEVLSIIAICPRACHSRSSDVWKWNTLIMLCYVCLLHVKIIFHNTSFMLICNFTWNNNK